jgi:hypothetical protein
MPRSFRSSSTLHGDITNRRLHAVPGDYVKVRINPSAHLGLGRPSSPGQLPLENAARANLLIVFFSCFNLGLVCVCCTT